MTKCVNVICFITLLMISSLALSAEARIPRLPKFCPYEKAPTPLKNAPPGICNKPNGAGLCQDACRREMSFPIGICTVECICQMHRSCR